MTNTYKRELLISQKRSTLKRIDSLLLIITRNQKKVEHLREIYTRIKSEKDIFESKRNAHASVIKKIDTFSPDLPFVQKLANEMNTYYKGFNYEVANSFMGSLLANINSTISKLEAESFNLRKDVSIAEDRMNRMNNEIWFLSEKINKGEV